MRAADSLLTANRLHTDTGLVISAHTPRLLAAGPADYTRGAETLHFVRREAPVT